MTHEQVQAIKVFDQDGQLVKNFDANLSAKEFLDLNDLAAGFYFLRIKLPNSLAVEKVVKIGND